MKEILIFLMVFAVFTALFILAVYNYNSRNQEELDDTEDKPSKEKYEDMEDIEKVIKQNRLIMKEIRQLRYDLNRIRRNTGIKFIIFLMLVLYISLIWFLYHLPEIRTNMILGRYI